MINKQTILPPGFVYIEHVDPTIMQNMIYYYERNFIGSRINGYKAPRAILTIEAANALKEVQQQLSKAGYSLVIYDAYRPKKAVEHFVNWGHDVNDQKMKDAYYPYIEKIEIFDGYVSKKSAHSRGSTVDLTIIELGKEITESPVMLKRFLKDKRYINYFDDNTVDMYSSVDLMDKASGHDSDLINEESLENRNYLRSIMIKHNFTPYSKEWWHYTLQNEPFKDQYFDFDIE